ncbi:MAG: GIY-YIG nuclease family protein [Herminiimonas sp.]|nr:GIY-YIG nuclease family protein [Herminiimonas sp.]
MTQYGKLVFVDLETTGANTAIDHITEIGVVEVDQGVVRRWSTLVNPGIPIPPFIQNLTGISDDMVRDAPPFAALAEELFGRLQGGLFIAHNARFDHGFLRKAFKQTGHALPGEVLCTVKLSRALFPDEPKHNLDALITRHELVADGRHRALADADLLWQLWNRFTTTIPVDTFSAAVRHQLKRPMLPPHLAPDLLDNLPENGGVYLFHGANDEVIYVGKGSNLRQRISSHFNPDRRIRAETELADLVHRIDWQEISGDVGQLLAETRLMKSFKPHHNRTVRKQTELCSWQLARSETGGIEPRLVMASDVDFSRTHGLYGLFGTRRKAEAQLRAIADTQALCLVCLGLESRTGIDSGCIAHTSGRCRGACVGLESPIVHQARLETALAKIKIKPWPYAGAAGLVETGADGRVQVHVAQHWRYLGTAQSDDEIWSILESTASLPRFDLEVYKILLRFFTNGVMPVRPLSAG